MTNFQDPSQERDDSQQQQADSNPHRSPGGVNWGHGDATQLSPIEEMERDRIYYQIAAAEASLSDRDPTNDRDPSSLFDGATPAEREQQLKAVVDGASRHQEQILNTFSYYPNDPIPGENFIRDDVATKNYRQGLDRDAIKERLPQLAELIREAHLYGEDQVRSDPDRATHPLASADGFLDRVAMVFGNLNEETKAALKTEFENYYNPMTGERLRDPHSGEPIPIPPAHLLGNPPELIQQFESNPQLLTGNHSLDESMLKILESRHYGQVGALGFVDNLLSFADGIPGMSDQDIQVAYQMRHDLLPDAYMNLNHLMGDTSNPQAGLTMEDLLAHQHDLTHSNWQREVAVAELGLAYFAFQTRRRDVSQPNPSTRDTPVVAPSSAVPLDSPTGQSSSGLEFPHNPFAPPSPAQQTSGGFTTGHTPATTGHGDPAQIGQEEGGRRGIGGLIKKTLIFGETAIVMQQSYGQRHDFRQRCFAREVAAMSPQERRRLEDALRNQDPTQTIDKWVQQSVQSSWMTADIGDLSSYGTNFSSYLAVRNSIQLDPRIKAIIDSIDRKDLDGAERVEMVQRILDSAGSAKSDLTGVNLNRSSLLVNEETGHLETILQRIAHSSLSIEEKEEVITLLIHDDPFISEVSSVLDLFKNGENIEAKRVERLLQNPDLREALAIMKALDSSVDFEEALVASTLSDTAKVEALLAFNGIDLHGAARIIHDNSRAREDGRSREDFVRGIASLSQRLTNFSSDKLRSFSHEIVPALNEIYHQERRDAMLAVYICEPIGEESQAQAVHSVSLAMRDYRDKVYDGTIKNDSPEALYEFLTSYSTESGEDLTWLFQAEQGNQPLLTEESLNELLDKTNEIEQIGVLEAFVESGGATAAMIQDSIPDFETRYGPMLEAFTALDEGFSRGTIFEDQQGALIKFLDCIENEEDAKYFKRYFYELSADLDEDSEELVYTEFYEITQPFFNTRQYRDLWSDATKQKLEWLGITEPVVAEPEPEAEEGAPEGTPATVDGGE